MKRLDLQKELNRSIKAGDMAEFIKILKMGADVNAQDDIGWTPLFYAVAAGDVLMVSELVHRGASPTIKDNSGWTPVGHARLDGNNEICHVLQPQ